VNQAYSHILPVVTKERVAAAHIAPASPALNGTYVLADIDYVINIMRFQGTSTVAENNLFIPHSSVDRMGHTLVGTYLDSTREGRARVKSMIEGEMDTLKSCRYQMRTLGKDYIAKFCINGTMSMFIHSIAFPMGTPTSSWTDIAVLQPNYFSTMALDLEDGAPLVTGWYRYSENGGDYTDVVECGVYMRRIKE